VPGDHRQPIPEPRTRECAALHPRSEAGNQRSSLSALRHGLTEDPAAYVRQAPRGIGAAGLEVAKGVEALLELAEKALALDAEVGDEAMGVDECRLVAGDWWLAVTVERFAQRLRRLDESRHIEYVLIHGQPPRPKQNFFVAASAPLAP